MKILVIEDDPLIADDLTDKLALLQHRVTAIVEDYESALEAIEKELPDLALVDIELRGEKSGIELGERLLQLKIPHIYLSGIQDMNTYIQAKSTAPLRNLAKPIDLINLRNALDVDLHAVMSSPNLIYLISDGNKSRQRIDPNKIYYLKADGSYCEVHTGNKTYKLTVNMKTCLMKLEWPDIIRVSKSHAINLQHVKSKLGNCIEMEDGAKIDIEPKYRDSTNKHFKSI